MTDYGNQFEEKAHRLISRLETNTNLKIPRGKIENANRTISQAELIKISQEIQSSQQQSRKKMKQLQSQLNRLEASVIEESQNRNKINQNFTNSLIKMQRNMKQVLGGIGKTFSEKQRKLQQKIDHLLKVEKKEIQTKLRENEEMIEEINRLQSKVMAIVEEVELLKKSRTQLEDKIQRQFSEQIIELKRIFELDVREREERQTKCMNGLKQIYKRSMQKIYMEEKQRQTSQKMLMSVVQQLVNRILEA